MEIRRIKRVSRMGIPSHRDLVEVHSRGCSGIRLFAISGPKQLTDDIRMWWRLRSDQAGPQLSRMPPEYGAP